MTTKTNDFSSTVHFATMKDKKELSQSHGDAHTEELWSHQDQVNPVDWTPARKWSNIAILSCLSFIRFAKPFDITVRLHASGFGTDRNPAHLPLPPLLQLLSV